MTKTKLINEIIKTCRYFKIIKETDDYSKMQKNINKSLEDIIFVENLLSIFYKNMNKKEFKYTLDRKRFKVLLMELEKIRLELEFKGV